MVPVTTTLRIIVAFLTLTITSAAHAEDLIFGFLYGDGTVSNFLVYRNGEWVGERLTPDWSPKKSQFNQIILDWVRAHNDKDKSKRITNDKSLAGKPMTQITAQELSDYLYSTEQTRIPADNLQYILTKAQGEWSQDKVEYWAGGYESLKVFVKQVWDSNMSSFGAWYPMDAAANTKPIRSWYVYKSKPYSTCNGDAWVIETDQSGNPNLEYADSFRGKWVANRIGRYAWRDAETVAALTQGSKEDQKMVPASLAPLIEQVKSRWAELEKPAIKKANIALDPNIAKRELDFFFIESAVWPKSNATLLSFRGKWYLPAVKGADVSVERLEIMYRAWVVLWPDGRVEWPRVLVEVGENPDSVSLDAVVELDKRQYVIARAGHFEDGGSFSWKDVFELVNGKFKLRSRTQAACRTY